MHVWASDSRFACLFKPRCAVKIKPSASHTPLAKKEKLSKKKRGTHLRFLIKVCPCTCRKFIHQRTISQHVLRVFFNASLKNSVFVLFKLEVCPWLVLWILTPMNVFICASREFWRFDFLVIKRSLHFCQNSKSKFCLNSRSVPARAENLNTNERLVSTCCEFFLTLR